MCSCTDPTVEVLCSSKHYTVGIFISCVDCSEASHSYTYETKEKFILLAFPPVLGILFKIEIRILVTTGKELDIVISPCTKSVYFFIKSFIILLEVYFQHVTPKQQGALRP